MHIDDALWHILKEYRTSNQTVTALGFVKDFSGLTLRYTVRSIITVKSYFFSVDRLF